MGRLSAGLRVGGDAGPLPPEGPEAVLLHTRGAGPASAVPAPAGDGDVALVFPSL